ncbi:MAG: RDD family protein [Deltaproteobacteria bacterium]|nr:RDD family protein [Deltaproteobacteria bacterium]
MAEELPYKGFDAEGEIEDLPKADVLERFLAKLIDFLIVGAFFAFPTFIGPLAGTTYILISDGLLNGQSLGKRVIGLRVVSMVTGMPCDFKQSIIRNAIFGVLIAIYFILGWIPYLGKLLVFAAWSVVVGVEMILVYTDELGSRFGDRIAGTHVMPRKGIGF